MKLFTIKNIVYLYKKTLQIVHVAYLALVVVVMVEFVIAAEILSTVTCDKTFEVICSILWYLHFLKKEKNSHMRMLAFSHL